MPKNPISEIEKGGGEFVPGVDKAAELHYVKKQDRKKYHRTNSSTMDELQTYTEFAQGKTYFATCTKNVC